MSGRLSLFHPKDILSIAPNMYKIKALFELQMLKTSSSFSHTIVLWLWVCSACYSGVSCMLGSITIRNRRLSGIFCDLWHPNCSHWSRVAFSRSVPIPIRYPAVEFVEEQAHWCNGMLVFWLDTRPHLLLRFECESPIFVPLKCSGILMMFEGQSAVTIWWISSQLALVIVAFQF